MFTGIIEEIGIIEKIELQKYGTITIRARKVLEDMHLGDSVAVNGVCLTVTSFTEKQFTLDVMAETLRRSNLGMARVGSRVNLERAMAANGRFGGHIVSGHVDGTGEIKRKKTEGNAVWLTIGCSEKILHYVIEKGSITIDGISLTVAKVQEDGFQVSIIPHTSQKTTLLEKEIGAIVNLEADILAKYIEKLITGREEQKREIDLDFLQKCGF